MGGQASAAVARASQGKSAITPKLTRGEFSWGGMTSRGTRHDLETEAFFLRYVASP
jgi:hypothetical protein